MWLTKYTKKENWHGCSYTCEVLLRGQGRQLHPAKQHKQWQKVLWPHCVFCSNTCRVFEKNFSKRTQTVMRILVSRFIWFVPITGLCRAINISVLMGLVAFAITQTHSMPLWQIRFCCAFLFLKWFTNCCYWWFIILNSFNLVRGSRPAQMYVGQSFAFSWTSIFPIYFSDLCAIGTL